MDVCHFCRSAIQNNYYRVNADMVCAVCVEREHRQEALDRDKYYRRGMLFGVPTAIAACFGIWGIRELSVFAGSSLVSPGAYLRGFTTLMLGGIIGGAIKAGAKRRSTKLTQVSAAALTYLAYAMAFVPEVLTRVMSQHHTIASGRAVGVSVGFLVSLWLIGLISPFWSVIKSPITITGLIMLFLAMRTAWSITGQTVSISGPFSSTDPTAELPPMFKTLGG